MKILLALLLPQLLFSGAASARDKTRPASSMSVRLAIIHQLRIICPPEALRRKAGNRLSESVPEGADAGR